MFDPIEDCHWAFRVGYKVEILANLLKLAQIDTQGATTQDQQSHDYGAEIERFFRELTYAWPQGAESRCAALPGPDDVLPVLESAGAWLVSRCGWSATGDLFTPPPALQTDDKQVAP